MYFKIERTRLITETFRIEADSEDDALQLLNECDTVAVPDSVEQIGLETVNSQVEITEIADAA